MTLAELWSTPSTSARNPSLSPISRPTTAFSKVSPTHWPGSGSHSPADGDRAAVALSVDAASVGDTSCAWPTWVSGPGFSRNAQAWVDGLKAAGFRDISYVPEAEDGRQSARTRLFERLRARFRPAKVA